MRWFEGSGDPVRRHARTGRAGDDAQLKARARMLAHAGAMIDEACRRISIPDEATMKTYRLQH